jgi:mannose-1-phosphate guanylyltransferase / phosphomannomutase
MTHHQVPCPWERKGALMRSLIEATQHAQRELTDGVKVHLGGDWVILYPDPDRPVFHILAEARTRARAEQIADEYREQVTHWLGGEGTA